MFLGARVASWGEGEEEVEREGEEEEEAEAEAKEGGEVAATQAALSSSSLMHGTPRQLSDGSSRSSCSVGCSPSRPSSFGTT
jgi:hypothetical protein